MELFVRRVGKIEIISAVVIGSAVALGFRHAGSNAYRSRSPDGRIRGGDVSDGSTGTARGRAAGAEDGGALGVKEPMNLLRGAALQSAMKRFALR